MFQKTNMRNDEEHVKILISQYFLHIYPKNKNSKHKYLLI